MRFHWEIDLVSSVSAPGPDVVLPLEASISVSVGQTVIGGETIIGELK